MPTGEKLAAERREAGLESTTSTSTISAAAPTTASGGDMGAQAKGMLDQVTSAVSVGLLPAACE
jgi:hypothetical protein